MSRLTEQIRSYEEEDKFVYSSNLRLRAAEIRNARIAADALGISLAAFQRAAIATAAEEVIRTTGAR